MSVIRKIIGTIGGIVIIFVGMFFFQHGIGFGLGVLILVGGFGIGLIICGMYILYKSWVRSTPEIEEKEVDGQNASN